MTTSSWSIRRAGGWFRSSTDLRFSAFFSPAPACPERGFFALVLARSHEPRCAEGGRDAFPHHRPAQRPDAGQRNQPEAAQEVGGQKGGEERPIEPIDRRGPHAHVEMPAALVAGKRLGAADVLAG